MVASATYLSFLAAVFLLLEASSLETQNFSCQSITGLNNLTVTKIGIFSLVSKKNLPYPS